MLDPAVLKMSDSALVAESAGRMTGVVPMGSRLQTRQFMASTMYILKTVSVHSTQLTGF